MMQDASDSFTDQLRRSAQREINQILEHRIILSLANVSDDRFPPNERRLSESELIEARNKFYIQDYYYLVYGNETIRNILVDRNPEREINRQLKIEEPRNPLYILVKFYPTLAEP